MIWLKLWTEANASEESNTGKYYGIFVAISIGGLLAMGVDIWFVHFLPLLGERHTNGNPPQGSCLLGSCPDPHKACI